MRRQLLVVDDDPDIRHVLKANLELHGFEALTAENAAQARQLLDRQLPALVILDLMLPDGDGMDLCKVLKREHPRMPVIMLTARDRLSDKVMGLDSGADDYMVKPFETLEPARHSVPTGARQVHQHSQHLARE